MTEPLRSALGVSSTEDTSLVLPSDKKQCTGPERVLQQVHSIKRSRSKIARDASLTPHTSPVTEYSEPKFQFSPTKVTGSLFRKSSTNMSRRLSRMKSHSLYVGSTVKRQIKRTSTRESQITLQSTSNGIKPGGSDPTLDGTVTQMTSKGNLSRTATAKNTSSTHSVRKGRSKSDTTGMNGVTDGMASMTLQKAVQYLTNTEESCQLLGASFIQHHAFTENKAKEEVCQLKGIPALIKLMQSENPHLQQTAAAALRNVVFTNLKNKLEVQRSDGIDVILGLLKSTNDKESQKQLTGLLWNLSSADALKPGIIESGLPLLTESIVLPYINTNKVMDPDIFYNITGCIRNLSCAAEGERKLMRDCPNLIDSLMKHIQCQVDIGDTDDKSVANCVCILHNLSYQLDKEAPEHFSVLEEKPVKKENTSKMIFSSKNTKNQTELSFPAMDSNEPEGVSWLYQKKSLQLYLNLLQSSQNEVTLEACCGALQNLTASTKPVSMLMSQTIADELKGLRFINPLLTSTNPAVKRAAISLVGNMSRVSELRGNMAKAVLPDISYVLTSVTPEMAKSDETFATACRVMHTLMMAEPEHGKKVLNKNLIDSLSRLSINMSFANTRRTAGVLLYSLWGLKDFQNVLKRQGMSKYTFINPATAASYKIETDERFSQ